MADPFSAFLQGSLLANDRQQQRAREIADQVFRDQQINLQLDKFKQDKNNDLLAARQKDEAQQLDWTKFVNDIYQAEETRRVNQERYDADRASREAMSQARLEAQKQIANMRNLSQEDRIFLTIALRNADTPEGVAKLLEWMRAKLSGGQTPAGSPSLTPSPTPPAPPAMEMAPRPDVLSTLFGDALTGTAPSTPPDVWNSRQFDPSQPFGGTAGAQRASRKAYAMKMQQEVAHQQEKYRLDDLKAQGSVAEQQARTDRLKLLAPEEQRLRQMQQQELQSRIQTRAREIALKERNAQWEQNYKQARADEKKTLAGGSLDALRTKMQTAGSAMTTKRKEIDSLLAETARLSADREARVPSQVKGGYLDGPARDSRIRQMNDRIEELWGVHNAAQSNYLHYRQILTETGNLVIGDKSKLPKPGGGIGQGRAGVKYGTGAKPPAVAAPPRAGARGPAKVTPPPAAKANAPVYQGKGFKIYKE